MFINYLSGLAALLLCLGALPVVKRVARKMNLYDPAGPLKIHQGFIPRLGGVAMFVGFLAGTAVIYIPASRPSFLPILVFALIWFVGLVDDLRTLSSLLRFSVQLAAGSALWFAGWRLQWFSSSFLDFAVTCLFVAFLINAMNLLDGMDGLAAATAAIACIGFLMISSGDGNALEIAVASCLLGSCVGVLFVNAPPAQMFMGDSGSTFIGIVLAFLSLNWVRSQGQAQSIAIPLIFLSVPLVDVLLAILRRSRSRQGLFMGDRRHYYDILLQRGWTVEGVLRISVCVMGTLVFAAWLAARGITTAWMTAALVLCGLAASALSLGSLQPDLTAVPASRKKTPIGPAIE